MARQIISQRNVRLTTQVTASGTYPGLVSQTNTALAALVNPIIRQFDFQVADASKRAGTPFYVNVSYETGGAALATPFTLSVLSANTLALFTQAVNDFLTANAALFVSGARTQIWDQDDSVLGAYYAAFLINATPGAGANFLAQ